MIPAALETSVCEHCANALTELEILAAITAQREQQAEDDRIDWGYRTQPVRLFLICDPCADALPD